MSVLARNETIFKWALYAAAALLCFLVQGAVLQRITIWGVIPFVYPVIAAVVASYEGSTAGTIFALALGVVCDTLVPESIPCFYPLIVPVVGLCAALISQSLIKAGYLCSLVVSAVSFILTGAFHCLALWAQGHAAWATGGYLMVRELCVSVLLSIPATALFSAVYHKTHMDD